ncbi:MAG: hypothetical protein ABI548_23485 [Polyangiaceae bacterium]
MTWSFALLTQVRRCTTVLLVAGVVCGMVACVSPQSRLVPPKPAQDSDLPEAHFKRVDTWRFVDVNAPLTPVEQQLKQQFERVFPNAQYSPEYTCSAREDGNFYDKYAARPEEWLGEQMAGRCGTPTSSDWSTRVYFSDGTILDSPLSDAMLNDISTRFAAVNTGFKVFGVTARYTGPNMLVTVETASPEATIHVSEADADRNVLVNGEVFGDFERTHAIINQGESGSADCDADEAVKWPNYAFKCTMAPGDDEAWVSLLASGQRRWESPLVELPAHRAGWVPPNEYHRIKLELPRQVDTPTALVIAINDLRAKLGRRPLHLASEQSAFMQPVYDRAFALNAGGDWTGDNAMRKQMLKGDRVKGAVSWARIASGIAYDGNAADWLAYRMLFPVARDTLMDASIDEIAIATHGDPAVGFGAAAVVYTLVTPEREAAMADVLAEAIGNERKSRPTKRLENPPELVTVAREVARGRQPIDALLTALTQLNLVTQRSQYLTGVFLPFDSDGSSATRLAPLLAVKSLTYGIVMTHVAEPNYGWATPFAFVWFVTDHPPERQARLEAAVVATLFVRSFKQRHDSVSVANDESRSLAKGRGISELLGSPLFGGVASDSDMHDALGVHVNDEESKD